MTATPAPPRTEPQRWIESLTEGHIIPWPTLKPVPIGWRPRNDHTGVPAREWPR